VDARNGWLIGDSVGAGVDFPCTVFLTEGSGYGSSVYVDIRSDLAVGPDEALIKISVLDVERAGVGVSDLGNLRFVVIQSGRDRHAGQLRGIAVDFPKQDRVFTDRLAAWGAMAEGQSSLFESVFDELQDEMTAREPDPDQPQGQRAPIQPAKEEAPLAIARLLSEVAVERAVLADLVAEGLVPDRRRSGST
jgi:hypothetical protein